MARRAQSAAPAATEVDRERGFAQIQTGSAGGAPYGFCWFGVRFGPQPAVDVVAATTAAVPATNIAARPRRPNVSGLSTSARSSSHAQNGQLASLART